MKRKEEEHKLRNVGSVKKLEKVRRENKGSHRDSRKEYNPGDTWIQPSVTTVSRDQGGGWPSSSLLPEGSLHDCFKFEEVWPTFV